MTQSPQVPDRFDVYAAAPVAQALPQSVAGAGALSLVTHAAEGQEEGVGGGEGGGDESLFPQFQLPHPKYTEVQRRQLGEKPLPDMHLWHQRVFPVRAPLTREQVLYLGQALQQLLKEAHTSATAAQRELMETLGDDPELPTHADGKPHLARLRIAPLTPTSVQRQPFVPTAWPWRGATWTCLLPAPTWFARRACGT